MNALALLIGYVTMACAGFLFALIAVATLTESIQTPSVERYRRLPRLDHDCDVMAGAPDEGTRLHSLYHADQALIEAAVRDMVDRAQARGDR